MPQFQTGFGAIVWCMSRYIHPGNPISKKYKNFQKGHNFEGLVLVGELNRSLCRTVGGGGDQCIISPMETYPVLIYSPHVVMFI